MKWIRRIALLLGIPAIGGAVALGIYIDRSIPSDRANHRLSVPLAEVGVTFDRVGIPLIEAKSERDLYFAIGFMHARDRLWQLEVNRRVGRGELAELFGAKALDTDKFLRTLGIHRAAKRQFENLPPETQLHLQRYADGVNAYVGEIMSVRPPEFVIVGVQPGRWEPVDSVAWMLMMAYDLSGNWGTELLRFQLASTLPVERIAELLPVQRGDRPLPTSDYVSLYKSLGVTAELRTSLLRLPQAGGIEGVGSNNWVVHGEATTTGKPLLANDPHLSLSAPAIWYFAKLRAPGIEVTGATLPGVPGVVLGRTRGVAWGFTNTGPDSQDLYLEEINAQGEARTPQGWSALSTRVETIRVKGGADVPITVRESRHGPIISDANAAAANALASSKGKFALALRWSALDADNLSAQAIFAMNKAQTVAELKDALKSFAAPQQNVVIADTSGATGFIAAGRVPLRRADNDLKGQAPAPGWDERYDWVGWLPFDQLPQSSRSAWRQPFFATANQRIHDDAYPHFISAEWAHPGRAERISTLLAAKPKHDAQSLREIQHDLQHTHDVPLMKWISSVEQLRGLSPQILDVLRKLKSKTTFDADGSEALLMWAWTKEVTRRIFADEIGVSLFDAVYGRRDFRPALNNVLSRNDAWWCDDKTTQRAEQCDDIVLASFEAALADLTQRYGDPSDWKWARAHVARSEHRPFSNVPVLARIFEVRTPTAGDTYSVMVGKLRLREPEPYLNEFAASLRAVYDLSQADPDAGSIIYSTGQSGNPFSPHFRDLAQRWGSGGASAYVELQLKLPSARMTLSGP